MSKNVFSIGLLLYAATMLLFFGLYFFGMNTDYFSNTLLINAFVLPAVYLAGAYWSVFTEKKKGLPMSFATVFGRAFKPMFTGGFLSIITIFIFFKVADPDAKDLLNYQYIERQKTELTNEYEKARQGMTDEKEIAELEKNYRDRQESFRPDMIKNKDMFSFRQMTYYFGAIMVFYVILSVFFASFFRSTIRE